jgi:isoquinoline 1-oxidoreductase alpha subunit
VKLNVNGKELEVDVDPQTPLLWVLRDSLGLTGTKYGCGIALCGACTVHVDGQPTRSCVVPVSAIGTQKITTIEGLSTDRSHPVQKAWIELDVPQCGYCQSGQIMSAVALLEQKPKPTDDDINAAMSGNICRCGTYQRFVPPFIAPPSSRLAADRSPRVNFQRGIHLEPRARLFPVGSHAARFHQDLAHGDDQMTKLILGIVIFFGVHSLSIVALAGATAWRNVSAFCPGKPCIPSARSSASC